jgi:ABC-2 type transport system ATP-binding protein
MMQLTNITKRYGTTVALNQLTLTIPEHAVFGLLGANGAGKSTLIRLLMGFIFPEQGVIDHSTCPPPRIGYVPERPFFPPACPADEYLNVAGKLANLSARRLRDEIHQRLTQVGLEHAAHWHIREFSKGMLQRLALAQALLGDPAFLILDEPMSGLDPAGQKQIRDLIKTLGHAGKTILFSTHRLDDVVDVCSHVAILTRGILVRAGALDTILTAHNQVNIRVNNVSACHAITSWSPQIEFANNTITLYGDAIALKPRVLNYLLEQGVDIQHLEQPHATLEEIYIEAQR